MVTQQMNLCVEITETQNSKKIKKFPKKETFLALYGIISTGDKKWFI